jgi:UDPglucose 6-dehydrogenase
LNIGVCGLWHLGLVVAACESERHDVRGYDVDAVVVRGLQAEQSPIFEPGLDELMAQHRTAGRLQFCSTLEESIVGADVAWITYDTPVDERDVADVEFVRRQTEAVIPLLATDAVLLVSSQVPVGFCAEIERSVRAKRPGTTISVVYSPENLQLGVALNSFRACDRVVIGTRGAREDARVRALFEPFARELVWMETESAEMTKHALNSFLATSLSFINEIAAVCEVVGGDSADVERALRLDKRIGLAAYVHPGVGFAGGTLARDVQTLTDIGTTHALPLHVLSAVWASNEVAKDWTKRHVSAQLPDAARVAVLGLTYKPNTNTLRRSSSVELVRWLHGRGDTVRAYDPAVTTLEGDLPELMTLTASVAAAVAGAQAVVIGTEWPEFARLAPDDIIGAAAPLPLVLDPKRVLAASFRDDARVRYRAVGLAERRGA